MDDVIFLDANVFMYAAGSPHSYKDACVRIIADVETGVLTAAINTEILQELLYRYSHIKLADKGVQLCRNILQYPLTVLAVTKADMHLAIELYDKHHRTGLKPRDAIHAATMLNNGLSRVISADRHFDYFDSLTRIDPLSLM